MNSYFFIDGFNIYHAIEKSFDHQKYKWLDLRRFSEQFIEPSEKIKEVLFFTAYAIWDKEKVKRHKTYIQALSHKNVTVIPGRFKLVNRNFDKKMNIISPENFIFPAKERIVFQTHEEKETDVNIAIRMFEYGMKMNCQKMYLVSADSDLIPAIKAIRRNFPKIHITNILPVKCKTSFLSKYCDDVIQTTEQHFINVMLDDEIRINENMIIKRPSEWK